MQNNKKRSETQRRPTTRPLNESHCHPRTGWHHAPVISPARSRVDAGFSLIELLITLAIILILTTMYFGFDSKTAQKKQLRACEKNLQNIYLALDIYAKENSSALPTIADATTSEAPLSQLVPRYTVASELFICPGSKDEALPNGEPFAERRISYGYFMGRKLSDAGAVLMSDRQVDAQPKPVGTPIFSRDGKPPGNNHHQFGGNFLFTDGHTETTSATATFAVAWPTNVTFLNPRK
jgi:prepilin-type N-terminal cleavage/methylation domain-containing protein/prepilin-type processing-associated H-X9-DG protein